MTAKDLAVVDFTNTIDVPASAPKPPEWMFDPHATIDDALPSNFFSMKGLREWLKDRNASHRLLTVRAVSCELMFDPSKNEKPKDGEWRPVLWFNEVESGLVINKTRAQHLKKISGSPLIQAWAKVGQIALTVDDFNDKLQIGILPVPQDSPNGVAEDANALLFGDDFGLNG